MNTHVTLAEGQADVSGDPVSASVESKIAKSWRFFLLPALLYTILFIGFTYPAILHFSSHIWCGAGDGLQMVWNVWWVDKAVSELHQQPWFTPYLHHPHGTHLLIHTFHPLKGLMGIPLLRFLSLGETYNVLVLFSFVMAGITAFWLALRVSKAYWPSIVGGFVFSFSNYHFAHAQGHMQLISMEWIPLFVLLWFSWLARPSWKRSLSVAASLLLVLMCDHYYFLYCVMAGGLMLLWKAIVNRQVLFFFRKPYLFPLVVFVLATLATSGVFVGLTMFEMHRDPPFSFFDSHEFSMDLLAFVIPGGHWRFNELTQAYWSAVPGIIHGSSVHVGIAVLVLAAIGAWRGSREKRKLGVWLFLAAFFFVMALGPRLYIWGWEAPYVGDYEGRWVKMPYTFLSHLVPPMKVGARPNRLVIITILSMAVLVPVGLRYLFSRGPKVRAGALGLLLLMTVEYLPSPLPLFRIETPRYVEYLASTDSQGAVFDNTTHPPIMMYFQTLHEHPVSFGYISRTHQSLFDKQHQFIELYEKNNFSELHDTYGFRFVVAPAEKDVAGHYPGARLVVEDDGVNLYDLDAQDDDAPGINKSLMKK
jgi:hypothetical protein